MHKGVNENSVLEVAQCLLWGATSPLIQYQMSASRGSKKGVKDICTMLPGIARTLANYILVC